MLETAFRAFLFKPCPPVPAELVGTTAKLR